MFRSYDQVVSYLDNQYYQDIKRQAIDAIKLYGDPKDDAMSELCADVEDDVYDVDGLEGIIKLLSRY